MVGIGDLLQQNPLSVTVSPPAEIMLAEHWAAVLVTDVNEISEMVASSGWVLKLTLLLYVVPLALVA